MMTLLRNLAARRNGRHRSSSLVAPSSPDPSRQVLSTAAPAARHTYLSHVTSTLSMVCCTECRLWGFSKEAGQIRAVVHTTRHGGGHVLHPQVRGEAGTLPRHTSLGMLQAAGCDVFSHTVLDSGVHPGAVKPEVCGSCVRRRCSRCPRPRRATRSHATSTSCWRTSSGVRRPVVDAINATCSHVRSLSTQGRMLRSMVLDEIVCL